KDKADSTGDLPRMGGRYLLAVGVGRGQLYAFRHHDQTEMLPAEFAGTNGIAHSFTSERNLRNQNDMRPSSNSRMQRDPACIAAHHLDEHHSMMALPVVCRRSIASVAITKAVSKPNVTSVASRSLSMVFGTPTMLAPLRKKSRAMCWVPSPPITIMASMPSRRALSMHSEE